MGPQCRDAWRRKETEVNMSCVAAYSPVDFAGNIECRNCTRPLRGNAVSMEHRDKAHVPYDPRRQRLVSAGRSKRCKRSVDTVGRYGRWMRSVDAVGCRRLQKARRKADSSSGRPSTGVRIQTSVCFLPSSRRPYAVSLCRTPYAVSLCSTPYAGLLMQDSLCNLLMQYSFKVSSLHISLIQSFRLQSPPSARAKKKGLIRKVPPRHSILFRSAAQCVLSRRSASAAYFRARKEGNAPCGRCHDCRRDKTHLIGVALAFVFVRSVTFLPYSSRTLRSVGKGNGFDRVLSARLLCDTLLDGIDETLDSGDESS